MKTQDIVLEFEWDKGNIDKNYAKHGVTPKETEEIFLDENLKVKKDVPHSQTENRFIAIGKNSSGKVLFVVFTIRRNLIRVISSRLTNKKDRKYYEAP